MAVIKKYNTGTAEWEPVVIGQQGFTGSQGLRGFTGSQGGITETSVNTFSNKTIHGDVNTFTVDGTEGVGYKKVPLNGDKTGSYTLSTSDVGKCITIGSGGSITIPNSLFAGGDAISMYNNTTGDVTVTCSITTTYISGADTNVSSVMLAPRGVATILFLNNSTCVISGNVS